MVDMERWEMRLPGLYFAEFILGWKSSSRPERRGEGGEVLVAYPVFRIS